MCAVIAHALAVIRRDVFGRECDPNECAAVALYHDCSEILTGDLPTPIKYHNALIRYAYREVEDIACARLIETLPAELRGAYEPLLTGETAARTHDIVKAADKLSAYISALRSAAPGTMSSSPPRSRRAPRWSAAECRRWSISLSISSRRSS